MYCSSMWFRLLLSILSFLHAIFSQESLHQNKIKNEIALIYTPSFINNIMIIFFWHVRYKVVIGMDVASSEFHTDGIYDLDFKVRGVDVEVTPRATNEPY